jgi:uncharacterized protein (DUF58 family)
VLTRSGLGVAVAAVVLVICGWWWGYDELVVVGLALAAAVGVAVWAARSSVRTEIRRVVTTPRVARGDPVRATYRVTNPTRRRSAPMILVDRLAEAAPPTSDHPDGPPPPRPANRSSVAAPAAVEVATPLPPVAGLDRIECPGLIPTRRRGTYAVGPWSLERVDQLGLAVGRRTGGSPSTIIVHPRVHALRGPYGAMHTVEDEAVIRKAASDPLSGFVSLREYVDGDDPRLIHWPTTARMGTLMLREHVELRRPEFTVVLDCAERVAGEDDFEEMVDVTASIAVHALRSGVNVTLKTTSRHHPGARRPVDRETRILDLLTPVAQVDDEHHMSLVEIFHAGIDHTMIMFVTGPAGPSTTLVHTDRIATVRVGQGATAGRGVVLAVDDAVTFAERWRPWP